MRASMALAGAMVAVRGVPAPASADDGASGARADGPAASGGTLAGVVVDRETRAPMEGVTVVARARGDDATPERIVLSERDGSFRFDGLPPGDYVLVFYDGESATERANLHVEAGAVVDVQQRLGGWPFGRPRRHFCVGPDGCPGWQVCSTELGECGGDMAPYEVCTGVCVPGRVHLAARAGGALALDRDGAVDGAGAFGVELLPPVVGRRLSVAADWWTEGAWRLGGALWLHPRHDLAVSARVDAFGGGGGWCPAVALRVDRARTWPLHLGPWGSHSALFVEVGVIAAEVPRGFVAVGLGGWLRWPGP